MRHRGGAKLPTRDSLMHHPAGSPWCSPVAQSGGTEVQVLTGRLVMGFYWPQQLAYIDYLSNRNILILLAAAILACMDCLGLRNTPIREAVVDLASTSVL